MVIVRSGVGVNYREPPDEIGRVGISVVCLQHFTWRGISGFGNMQ